MTHSWWYHFHHSFYLVVNGLLLFVIPNYNLLDFGYASLQVYFDFAPWFLLLLVPAITMRSFSDEFKQGTYEVLHSLPFSSLQLVLGKLLGSLLIVIAAIAPTIFYAFVLGSQSFIIHYIDLFIILVIIRQLFISII